MHERELIIAESRTVGDDLFVRKIVRLGKSWKMSGDELATKLDLDHPAQFFMDVEDGANVQYAYF